jgi:hypothetical protein
MSWEAWGEPDEGPDCGECGAFQELKDSYDELRKLAWAIIRTTVYQNGKMAEGISVEMVAAMCALHDELIVTEPVHTSEEAERSRQAMERIKRRKAASPQGERVSEASATPGGSHD